MKSNSNQSPRLAAPAGRPTARLSRRLFPALALALLTALSAHAGGAAYIGNSLAVTPSYAPDGLSPLVILGEYSPVGPLAMATVGTTLPNGVVEDVRFYGKKWDFMLFALSRVASDPGDNTQLFRVEAYSHCFGTNLTAGIVTNSVSNFCVKAGQLVAFAGIGPYYPQAPNDATNSDATYEDGTNVDSFIAVPPLLGDVITMGTHYAADIPPAESQPPYNAQYGYISDTYKNQGRTYAIGVDVLTNEACSGCINIENPASKVYYTCSNGLPINFRVGYYDSCCTNATLTTSVPETGYVFPVGTTTVTSKVTDNCDGETYSQSFTITVIQETGSPVINCLGPIIINCPKGSSTGPMPDETKNAALVAGNNVPVTVTQSVAAGTQVHNNTPVTFTVVNACGDTNSCTTQVELIQDPVLTTQHPLGGSGISGVTVDWTVPNGQLQESSDLINWSSIPGATNPPYVSSNVSTRNFYRLVYKFDTNN